MASSPSFTSTPRLDSNQAVTAETSLTAPTNAVLVFTAGANGSLITRIDVSQSIDTGGTFNDTVLLYWYNGSSYMLWKAVDVDGVDVVAGAPPFQTSLLFAEGLPVPGSGCNRLYAGIYAGNDCTVTAYGGDF